MKSKVQCSVCTTNNTVFQRGRCCGGQRGFTLIELIIVIVILGILSVVAMPAFVDFSDDAKRANIKSVAASFATSVKLVKYKWETSGRPSANGGHTKKTVISLGSSEVGVDPDTGFATSGDRNTPGNTSDHDVSSLSCAGILTQLSGGDLRVTSDTSLYPFDDYDYYAINRRNVHHDTLPGDPGVDVCYYYETSSVRALGSAPPDRIENPNGTFSTEGNGFRYNPRIGDVKAFFNGVVF